MTKRLDPAVKEQRASDRAAEAQAKIKKEREAITAKVKPQIDAAWEEMEKRQAADAEASREQVRQHHLAEADRLRRAAEIRTTVEDADSNEGEDMATKTKAGGKKKAAAAKAIERTLEKVKATAPASSNGQTSRRNGPPAGQERCPGSTVDVEAKGLEVQDGAKLRDKNPWDYRGKKVICPGCGRKVGTYPTGSKKKQKEPTAYKIDTHYREIGATASKRAKAKPAAKKAAKAKA